MQKSLATFSIPLDSLLLDTLFLGTLLLDDLFLDNLLLDTLFPDSLPPHRPHLAAYNYRERVIKPNQTITCTKWRAFAET